VITPDEMFAPMLVACPDFLPKWETFVADWQSPKQKPLPYYFLLNELAQHLVLKLGAEDTDAFRSIFDVVELWHVRGDDYVQQAASIGLLEDLQNPANYRSGKPGDFMRWFGPVSKLWWDKVEDYWAPGIAKMQQIIHVQPPKKNSKKTKCL
jgi:hypothetical protein